MTSHKIHWFSLLYFTVYIVKSSLSVCSGATKNMPLTRKPAPDCVSVDEDTHIAQAMCVSIPRNLQLATTALLGTQKDNQKTVLDPSMMPCAYSSAIQRSQEYLY